MASFDGGLYIRKQNASFIMNMRKENLDYVLWVKETIENVCGCNVNDRKDYNTDGCIRQPQVRLDSRTHPFLTTIRNRIYTVDNKKVIDPHMLTLMDAEALAIIFMCDGSTYLDTRFKNPHGSITLNTKGYSYHDNMALSKSIYEAVGIRTTVNRQNNYYYLRVKSQDIKKFVEVVKPFVKESFYYKLERLAPLYVGGDIVCSIQECIGSAEMT